VSDEGIKATVAKVLNTTLRRCRVHFMRNALAHAGKSGRRVISAFIATAFAQDDAEAATTQLCKADRPGSCRRTRCPTASYTAPGDTIVFARFPRRL
jgi:transposase-like protein